MGNPQARLESRHEIRDLRRLAADNPADPSAALALARRYIELGRAEADPRYLWLSRSGAAALAAFGHAIAGGADLARDLVPRPPRIPGGEEPERQWALTTLAEIAVRLGRFEEA